jgi:hypothetical protein
MNAPIARLRRLRGCARPWHLTLGGARREIRVSSRALVTPKMLRKVAQSSGVRRPADEQPRFDSRNRSGTRRN